MICFHGCFADVFPAIFIGNRVPCVHIISDFCHLVGVGGKVYQHVLQSVVVVGLDAPSHLCNLQWVGKSTDITHQHRSPFVQGRQQGTAL